MTSDGDRTLRVYGVVNDSIVDGPGLRLAIFTQGCPHGCPGCHNPDSHAPDGGHDESVRALAERAVKNPLLSGVTLSGGEPMQQAGACIALLNLLPAGLSRWLYTGYTWAEIQRGEDAGQKRLLEMCDVVVDGRFVLAERSLETPYRGSRNQRLIDVKRTLAAGEVVCWAPPAG